MNSVRADPLRLILPLLPRMATVYFFGADDFRERVEALLGFDEGLFDEDRDEDDRDRPLFWATTVNGRTSMTVASATPVRLSIRKLLSCPDYRCVRMKRQGKLGRSDWLSSSGYRASCPRTVYRFRDNWGTIHSKISAKRAFLPSRVDAESRRMPVVGLIQPA